jgi:hypothetical protein
MGTLNYSSPVTLRVQDAEGLRAVYIFAEIVGGVREVVYESGPGGEQHFVGLFGTKYPSGVRNFVSTGFDYTFVRDGGWFGTSLRLVVHAVDASGTLVVSEITHTVIPEVVETPADQVTFEAAATGVLDPIDILLDENGDLDISTGDIQLSSGLAGVVQAVKLRFGLFRGEWFADLSAGIPWWEEILIKSPNIIAVREHFRLAILDTPYITEVTALEMTFNPSDRSLTVTWAANTDFGSTGEQTEELT